MLGLNSGRMGCVYAWKKGAGMRAHAAVVRMKTHMLLCLAAAQAGAMNWGCPVKACKPQVHVLHAHYAQTQSAPRRRVKAL